MYCEVLIPVDYFVICLFLQGISISIANSTVTLQYVGDNHHSAFDAFVLYFQLTSKDEAKEAEKLHVNCTHTPSTLGNHSGKVLPISYRHRVMNERIVLVVSQYYSTVELPWIELFLKHYLRIGVDVVALYTGFSPQSQYSVELDTLLNNTEFVNHVVRFEWSDIAGLKMWGHSQTSMINHAVNVFLGSTIISVDLDEILVPIHGSSIRPIVDEYNKEHGSWGFNMLSYTPSKQEFSRLKSSLLKYKIDYWDWKISLKRSVPCPYPQSRPFVCQAKWIFHSLEPDIMRVHDIRFLTNATFSPNGWLDPNKIALLHVRKIQRLEGLALKTKGSNSTAE